jgi:very-short-patch-repair endonuclease
VRKPIFAGKIKQMNTEDKIKIIKKYRNPTKEATDLKQALEEKGVRVLVELHDGHKHIDLAIPKAKLNIEVDGIQHLTDPNQIVSDLSRGYYSHKNGYDTMHVPNEMVRLHKDEIASALAEASKIREQKIYLHME